MCTLELGIYTVGEAVTYRLPCEYRKVADEWLEQLGAQTTWPKTHVARLELWPEEGPLVLRMENVYSARVDSCASYLAYRRVTQETAVLPVEPPTKEPS